MTLAYYNLSHYKRMNSVMLLSFVVGLLMPLLIVANINVFVASFGNLEVIQSDEAVLIKSNNVTLDETEIKARLKASDIVFNDIAFVYTKAHLVELNGDVFLNNITYSDAHLFNFEKFEQVHSKIDAVFSGNNEALQCIVGSGFFSRHKGVTVGDTLKVDGKVITISNRFNSMNYYSTVLVDKNVLSVSNATMTRVYIRLNDVVTPQILSAIESSLGQDMQISEIISGKDAYNKQLKSGVMKSGIILIAGIFGVLLSVGNIALLVIARAKRLHNQHQTQMALGANLSDIIWEQSLELFMFLLVALLLDACVMPLVLWLMQEGLDFVMTPSVYVIVAVLFGVVIVGLNIWIFNHTLEVTDV